MLKEYDNAWAKYQKGIKIIPTPLLCWDFYSNIKSEETKFKNIQQFWKDKSNLLSLAKKQNQKVVITDKNFRIVFASDTISEMNGYQSEEMLGKSPVMFQGEKTSKRTTLSIKNAINKTKPFKEVILNYKKNGEEYWCQIEAFPMFNVNGEFLNYIAFEKIAS
jgi:PAS domain S-box-containing protein